MAAFSMSGIGDTGLLAHTRVHALLRAHAGVYIEFKVRSVGVTVYSHSQTPPWGSGNETICIPDSIFLSN